MENDKPRRRGRPVTGAATSPAERMRQLRARRKAAGLTAVTRWQVRDDAPTTPTTTVPANGTVPGTVAGYSSHRVLDARSLALHVLIVRKIEREPSLLRLAFENLRRWKARHGSDLPAWVAEWTAILDRPWPEVAAVLTEQSENAVRLRQSSPFAGILTSDERRRVYDAFRA